MFSPMKAMKLFNERKEFANAHPDMYKYIKEVFGSDMPAGSKIEINVRKAGKEEEKINITVGEKDTLFFTMLKDLVR